MQAIYRINAQALDQRFIDALKATFGNQDIEIAVSEQDDTDYLLRTQANRDQLLLAMKDVDSGIPLVIPDQAQFAEV